MAKLTAGQVAFAPIKDFRTAQGCGVTGGIRESGGGPATLSRPTVLSCDMALRLLDFETEVIEPLAGNVLHQRVIRIDHAGSYSCRVLAERPEQLSQHAFGKAIDIMGFGLADGSTISVVKDWHGKGSKAAFLHQLARQACGRFSVVLTPNANRAHFNHIHMDIGPQKYCR